MSIHHATARMLGVFDGDPVVTDLLLRHADARTDITIAGEVSAATAIAVAKSGGVKKALAIAIGSRDPAVLDHLARKDSRLTMRRAVAANTNTSVETLEYLFGWASGVHDESEVLLWSRLPLSRAVSIARSKNRTGTTFGDHPDLEGDPELALWACDQTDFPNLVARASVFLAMADDPRLPGVIDTLAPEIQVLACQGIWGASAAVVSKELAERIVTALAGIDLTPRRYYFGSESYSKHACSLSDDARRVLVASGNTHLVAAAAGKGAPADVRAAAIATADPRVLEVLCRTLVDFDEIADLLSAAESLPLPNRSSYVTSPNPGVDDTEWLLQLVPDLPSELRLRILRRQNSDLTQEWITGKSRFRQNLPRPGEVAALLENPGTALSLGRNNTIPSAEELAATVSRFVTSLPLGTLNTNPAVAEAFEYADQQVHSWANSWSCAEGLDRYVTRRLNTAFGSQTILWETALSLASSWQGRLEQLIDATFAATGLEPAVTAPPNGQEISIEQLALID